MVRAQGTALPGPRADPAPVQRQQLLVLLESSPAAIVIVDAEGLVREWNPAAEQLLGWSREEVVGAPVRRLVPVEGQPAFEELASLLLAGASCPSYDDVLVHRDGSRVPVLAHLAALKDPDDRFAGVVCTLSPPVPPAGVEQPAGDPGEDLDNVTGLPGRRWLQRRLAEPLRPGEGRGVAVLDVDAFALLNQDYGPDAADQVLRELGQRLAALPDAGDVGRWQADEFVYVVDGADPVSDLADLGAYLRTVTRVPFRAGGDSVHVTLSAGLASDATVPLDELFRAATAALHAAKEVGRDRVVWYDRGQHPSLSGGLRLAHDLSRGIADGQLRLHYQPIVELATNDATGVEALVRWQRPGVGLLAPGSFIDVAERTGQVVALGRWVTHQACAAAVKLAAMSARACTVSINISARQLSDPDLVPMLSEALTASGCPPTSISVEVTETAVLNDLRAATAVLEDIKQLGVGLDLDDFGTGYSSLLYLKHFPVDRIKIDQSFVGGLGTDAADTAIVASTIALAHSVGLRAVAEGVETPGQLALLRQMGCDFAQGYLLSRPMPFAHLCEWLAQDVPSRLRPRATSAAEVARPAAGAREQVADRRDRVGDQRDDAADRRDRAGDQRDDVGQRRDQAGDQRDRAADEREDLADLRELAADRRDVEADARSDRDRGPTGEPEVPSLRAALADAGAARQEAATDRSQALHERDAGAVERSAAERGRNVAQADRGVGASERRHAGRDRQRARAGRESAAHEPDAASVDALTGGYQLAPGLVALGALVDRAAASAERVVVACVEVQDLQAVQDRQGHTGADSVLVGVANAVTAALRPPDLLIRYGPSTLVCAFPGLGRPTVLKRLRVAQTALAGPPRLGTVSLRVVELRPGESAEQVVDRLVAGAGQ
jgi:PAS domain S-box-containing protein/diguanylate cyclase (GGDEF)-like protein